MLRKFYHRRKYYIKQFNKRTTLQSPNLRIHCGPSRVQRRKTITLWTLWSNHNSTSIFAHLPNSVLSNSWEAYKPGPSDNWKSQNESALTYQILDDLAEQSHTKKHMTNNVRGCPLRIQSFSGWRVASASLLKTCSLVSPNMMQWVHLMKCSQIPPWRDPIGALKFQESPVYRCNHSIWAWFLSRRNKSSFSASTRVEPLSERIVLTCPQNQYNTMMKKLVSNAAAISIWTAQDTGQV